MLLLLLIIISIILISIGASPVPRGGPRRDRACTEKLGGKLVGNLIEFVWLKKPITGLNSLVYAPAPEMLLCLVTSNAEGKFTSRCVSMRVRVICC